MNVFYSLFFINLLVQVIVFVPTMLISERFEGSVMAIPAGVLIGTSLLLIFVRSMNAFPGKTLPEILSAAPRWFRAPFLIGMSFIWFSAGMISLLSINNIAIRFINVSLQGPAMILIISIFVAWIMFFHKSEQIIALVSVIFVLNLPLIGVILYQAVTSEYMMWSSILEVGTHWTEFPSYQAITASTFMFTGYTNLVVFNKLLTKPIQLKKLWPVSIIGLVNLLTSFLIPIGLLGADGVDDFVFPWVVTADSLQVQYGPIERLISVFLLLYISITTLSILIHWHVSHQLLLSFIKGKGKRGQQRRMKYATIIILAAFIMTAYLLEKNTREHEIFRLAELWMNIRLPAEFILVLTIFRMARRKRA
ncbi:hypothetical protein SAMN02799630_01520 [Paenibacillus sp. UNCCL117]|uniref:hypothetical protein n=1 Tax=unclassified Paenibacillus TaxID=185978 RepID=UPI000883AD15|nr:MULTISPECIES: hypothetical protein [unclassified Paenibacillus]SDC85512.1 hypothetical protein SAMN04488602_1046 [Paenibacillus sp. cl123]SFW27565.1 hypothetical protein SAMN02799630_01520 [Paenibacillus sp. UNCCL117]